MNNSSIRIKSLDLIKGITILSVINMHVCAWSGTLYLPDLYRGIASLWNIPVFFFIAGFLSAGKSNANDSFIYVTYQSIKILRDLFIVLTFCLAASTFYLAATNPDMIFSHEYIQSVLSAFLFRSGGILLAPWRVLPGSYWFIVIYFKLLLLTVPAYYLIRENIKWQPMIILAIVYWFIVLFADKTLLFYMPLFWLGFIYKNKPGILPPRIAVIISGLLFVALGIWIFIIKAIPNFSISSPRYLVVALQPILILTILIYLEGKGKFYYRGISSKLLQWAGKNSLRIYLWEAVVTSLPYFYVPYLQNLMSPFSLYMINLLVSIGLTLIVTRVHEMILSKFSILNYFRVNYS